MSDTSKIKDTLKNADQSALSDKVDESIAARLGKDATGSEEE